MIDKILDQLNIGVRNGMEIEALGEVETNNIIGIFVCATLPGLMRLGEIDQRIKLFFDLMEICELGAIIETDASDGKTIEQGGNCSSSFLCIPAGNVAKAKKACFAIHKRNQQTLADAAIDRVAFPVADAAAGLDFIRPLRDNAIGLNAVIAGGTRHHTLSATAKMLFRRDAGQLFLTDITVDRGNAQRFEFRILQAPAAGDGFRRPAAIQSVDDEIPRRCPRGQRSSGVHSSAVDVQILCVPSPVPIGIIRLFTRLILCPVATDFPADARYIPAENRGDSSQAVIFPQKIL